MRVVRVFTALVLLCSSACSSSGPEERTSNNQGTKEPYAGPSAYTITPQYVVPGMSNIDSLGLFMFSFPPESGSLQSFTQLVESHAYFMNAAGDRIALQVLPIIGKDGEEEPRFQVTATPPLVGDAWHWLVVERDEDLGVSLPGASVGTWSAHFFTASALHVVAVSSSSSDPTSLRVTLSEPVDLSSQLDPQAFVSADGEPISECFLVDGVCANPYFPVDNTLTTKLAHPFSPTSTLALALDSSIMGSGRLVAEGAQSMGMPLEDGKLVLSLTPSDWTTCDDDSTCWGESRALPPASE